jgi:hypothetical protein
MNADSIQNQVAEFITRIGDRIAPTMKSDEVVVLLEEAWCDGHMAAMWGIQRYIDKFYRGWGAGAPYIFRGYGKS